MECIIPQSLDEILSQLKLNGLGPPKPSNLNNQNEPIKIMTVTRNNFCMQNVSKLLRLFF